MANKNQILNSKMMKQEYDPDFFNELQFFVCNWHFMEKGRPLKKDTFYDVTDALDMQNMEKIENRYREKKGVENKGTLESHILHVEHKNFRIYQKFSIPIFHIKMYHSYIHRNFSH